MSSNDREKVKLDSGWKHSSIMRKGCVLQSCGLIARFGYKKTRTK